MKTLIKPLAVILFLVMSASSHAQDFVKRGTTEMGGSALFAYQNATREGNHSQSGHAMTLLLDLYAGFMITDGFELGFMPAFIFQDVENISGTIFNLFLAPSFNMNPKGTVHPFVEILLGFNAASSGNGLGYGLDVGTKAVIGTRSLFVFQVQFLRQFYNSGGISGNSQYSNNIDLITVSAGLGFRIFTPREVTKKK